MYCESCGMSMDKPADFGGGKRGNRYCVHCSDRTGVLKAREEVHDQMVSLFLRQRGGDRATAKRTIETYMSKLPAWRAG